MIRGSLANQSTTYLWNKIYGIISVSAKLCWWLCVFKFLVELHVDCVNADVSPNTNLPA